MDSEAYRRKIAAKRAASPPVLANHRRAYAAPLANAYGGTGRQIVIPMSGRGSRYAAAGYANIKPLIQVDGRPIIEHIVRLFPGERDFVFICALRDDLETTLLRDTRTACPRRQTGIEPHKKGPVWAALMAEQLSPTTSRRCCTTATSASTGTTSGSSGTTGLTTTRRAASLRTAASTHWLGPEPVRLHAGRARADGGHYMLEIQEKHCFTDDRMKEYASSGAYYFRRGRLSSGCSRQPSSGPRINGEFYASMPYNLLVADGICR